MNILFTLNMECKVYFSWMYISRGGVQGERGLCEAWIYTDAFCCLEG